MAIFRNEPEEFQRVDWMLLQDGAVSLYFHPQVLAEDVEWLKTHDYRVDDFDCSARIASGFATISSAGWWKICYIRFE